MGLMMEDPENPDQGFYRFRVGGMWPFSVCGRAFPFISVLCSVFSFEFRFRFSVAFSRVNLSNSATWFPLNIVIVVDLSIPSTLPFCLSLLPCCNIARVLYGGSLLASFIGGEERAALAHRARIWGESRLIWTLLDELSWWTLVVHWVRQSIFLEKHCFEIVDCVDSSERLFLLCSLALYSVAYTKWARLGAIPRGSG